MLRDGQKCTSETENGLSPQPRRGDILREGNHPVTLEAKGKKVVFFFLIGWPLNLLSFSSERP